MTAATFPDSAQLQFARQVGERDGVAVRVRSTSGDVVFGPHRLDQKMLVDTLCQRLLDDKPVCQDVTLLNGTAKLAGCMPLGHVAIAECVELSAVFSPIDFQLLLPCFFSDPPFGIHIMPGDGFDERQLSYKVGDVKVGSGDPFSIFSDWCRNDLMQDCVAADFHLRLEEDHPKEYQRMQAQFGQPADIQYFGYVDDMGEEGIVALALGLRWRLWYSPSGYQCYLLFKGAQGDD